ncbi:hypothetical protein YSA_00296 [Pseudomonas putida ND6]|uniref:Uncharacterized protein n=1 Tax=Pseudomonas putida ND6 TaxID=231023 RepID=I3UN63_PSEPU|nr:hypothetical protein YSA_00296 [Pseudomonas putida ND6]
MTHVDHLLLLFFRDEKKPSPHAERAHLLFGFGVEAATSPLMRGS